MSDLHKRYDDVVALDGVSFAVRPGRMLGFLGPNGAGKTTSMRAVFGSEFTTSEGGSLARATVQARYFDLTLRDISDTFTEPVNSCGDPRRPAGTGARQAGCCRSCASRRSRMKR